MIASRLLAMVAGIWLAGACSTTAPTSGADVVGGLVILAGFAVLAAIVHRYRRP